MYVALGAVLTLLLVFAFGRSVWSLSNLYARRKRDKDLPATILELQAEKNRLRAEHAMMNRKLEVGTEEMKAKVVTQMAEVARHRNRLLGMSQALEENAAQLESSNLDTSAIQDRLEETVNELVEHKKTIGTLQDTLAERDSAIADQEAAIARHTARFGELQHEVARLGELLETTVKALEESNQHAAELEMRFLDMQTDAGDVRYSVPVMIKEFNEGPVMQPPSNAQPFNNFETRRRIADIAAKAVAGVAPTTALQGTAQTKFRQMPGSGRNMKFENSEQSDEFKSLITEVRGEHAQALQTDETALPKKNENTPRKPGPVENVVSLAQRIRALQKKNDEKLSKDLK
jgi:hypothetical protein